MAAQKSSEVKSIEINAPAAKVWQVFTNPMVTRHLGGEYVSEWQVGSAFGWKGLDGAMLTRGTILKIEPQKLLQHNLLGSEEDAAVTSIITYELRENNGRTTLLAREDFTIPVDEQTYSDAAEGWEAALGTVKELAENS